MGTIWTEIVSELVTEMESELGLQMGFGMPSESKLIGYVLFERIHNV